MNEPSSLEKSLRLIRSLNDILGCKNSVRVKLSDR
jgi:hypothetical protein